jgi:hypothetical protein
MRFEVLAVMKMSILVFWVVMPHELIGRYQRFRGTYYSIFRAENDGSLVSTYKSTQH